MTRSDIKTNRIGESKIMKGGILATIIDYKANKDVIVKFENGEVIHCIYNQFKLGTLQSKYYPSVHNIGYLGEGLYEVKENNNKDITIQYKTWSSMLGRCYSDNNKKDKTYKNCSVCEEWHNFQNFAKWFDENYYEVENEVMELDKDILHKGNKIYSPENCIFVPNRINCLFTKNNINRGEYPIGVTYHKRDCVFESACNKMINNRKKSIYLGRYSNPEEAFYKGYKPFKENYIKEVANQYKDMIPERLYNAMMKYEVEIND